MDIQNTIFDAYDDEGLSVFCSIVEESRGDHRDALTKSAEHTPLLNGEELSLLRQDQFALNILTKTGEVLNKYPVSDASQTWLSSQYFVKTGGSLPEIAQIITSKNLNHAARVFNIDLHPAIEKIANLYPNITTNVWVEGSEPEFAQDTVDTYRCLHKIARDPERQDNRYWGLSNGGKLRYQLKTANQVKVAAAYFEKNSREFSPEERNEFATRISARSLEFGIPEAADTPAIVKHAGTDFGERFYNQLSERVGLCDELNKDRGPYLNLFKNANALGAQQTAMAMQHFDRKNGFDRYYDKSIDDPYATTFGDYFKKTAAWSMDVGGKFITEKDLKGIDENKFKKSYGESMWNEFQRNPSTILESLPKPDQAAIIDMIPGRSLDFSEEDLA